jgi:acylphosphatase
MITVHVFVTGFVQGVGYRAFVKKHALNLGLVGLVKNLPDGRVEAIFQGDKKRVGQMVDLCKKGPFMSEVEDVVVRFEDKDEKIEGFSILHN